VSAQPTSEELDAVALAAMRQAYAPYSGFRVGAALLAADGRIFAGCNVENASFGGTICAERGAVLRAVADGTREFVRIVIATEAEHPTPPCGLCRQVLAEFAPTLEVCSLTAGGDSARWSMAELLPAPFSPASMERR
jgi:cytidine deaminase